MRGAKGNFKIFAACLILGVATITGIGSISASLSSGVDNNARSLLGGDISIELSHRPLSPVIINFLEQIGLNDHLSPTRKNGLSSLVSSIKNSAKEKLT